MRYSLLFLVFIALVYCVCESGTYNAAGAGEPEDCKPCNNAIAHCVSCNSDGTVCNGCDDKFYPDGNTCKSCPDHCRMCSSASGCTTCDLYYYLEEDDNSCKPCHNTCLKCNGPDVDQCKECRDPAYQLADKTSESSYCKKCDVEGCIAYGSNHRRGDAATSCNCVVCANGYTLNAEAHSEDPATCTKCNVEGCGKCNASDPNKCEECSPGTYKTEDGKCKSCKKGCLCTSDDPNKCDSCIDGFYKDDNNDCKACKKEGCVCSKSNPDACSRCVYGYVYDEDNEKCTKPKGNDAFGFNTFFTAFFCFALALIAVL